MTKGLDSDRHTAWRAYIEASQRLFTRLEDDLRVASGLSFADYHVLVLLSEAPGQRLRMGELAGRLVFSPSRLTYQISSMQRRGLVTRAPCPDDGRGNEAVLTAAGLLTLREAAPHHLHSVRTHLMDDLDDAEVACLTRIFTRLGQRLTGANDTAATATAPGDS
ncbi:DNA-binding transcriptional regulator, MarR family [Micromonospora phaseoli]|uniref:DNA-binding transcriptional regulator, MarR family n=1 Tax=Micromonospora phaseoli TaxID=1144548 RepID=A0A1H6SHM1_9ACTN|nr:MarR family transcriptional regulator [Micromonospora phaseoli]PZW03967.1 DNA-binding MarR family transcriptional regulator [Micromonospora phaseoli]GIJ77619.1 MarR family transcriptional regulator [Micromonospora phaseoli]SEI67343.1 DNA-binding transcriptional regulator, MarR family [Micromonospora phaseoli]